MHAISRCILIQNHSTNFKAINSNSFHLTIRSRVLFDSFTCKYVFIQCSVLIWIQWYNEYMTFGCRLACVVCTHASFFWEFIYQCQCFLAFISIFAAVKANCWHTEYRNNREHWVPERESKVKKSTGIKKWEKNQWYDYLFILWKNFDMMKNVESAMKISHIIRTSGLLFPSNSMENN